MLVQLQYLTKNHNIILQKLKDNPLKHVCLTKIAPLLKNFILMLSHLLQAMVKNDDNNLFDIVHSSATIEHVGSLEDQLTFVSECFIIKKRVYLTTPNRNYPIDFHTKLPLIHLLPKNT